MSRVRIKSTKHGGLMPGDEGVIEHTHLNGFAVKFDCIRTNERDEKGKTKKTDATVFMLEAEFIRLPEIEREIEANPS